MANNAPGVRIEEVVSANTPITGAVISTAGMLAETRFGTLREPQLCTSFDEFVQKFGSYQTSSDAAYNARLFFENGGSELWVSRLAHYDDLTDPDSFVGDTAVLNLDDIQSLPAETLTVNAKYPGEFGDDVAVTITHAPIVTTSPTSAISTGDTYVNVNSTRDAYVGQVFKIMYGADPETLAEAIALANNIKTQYNAHLGNVVAHDIADATNTATSPAASNLATLLTLVNELRNDYEAHRIFSGGGNPHNSSDTTNVISLQLSNATDLSSAITLLKEIRDQYEAHRVDAVAHNSADSTNFVTTVEYAKVETVENEIVGSASVKRLHFTDALANDFDTSTTKLISQEFNLNVYLDAGLVEEFTGLSIESDVDNYCLTVVNDEATGSALISLEDPSASNDGDGTDIPAQELLPVSLSGGTSVTAGLAVLDLVGESTGGTGFYAFDDIDVGLIFACASSNEKSTDPVVLKLGADYCAARKSCFFLAECDKDLTPAQAKDAIQDASIDSSFIAVFYNRLKVLDRDTGSLSLHKYVSPLGAIAGKIATVDALYGPHEAAAGEAPYGNLSGTFGVERNLTIVQRSLLNDANINPIYLPKGRAAQIYGVRTQDPTVNFRYINVRRNMIYIQQSIVDAMQGRVFRNNNLRLWTDIRGVIRDFLIGQLNKGALKGASVQEAFFVKVGEVDGVQTANDTLNGRLIAEIGVSLVRPSEFLIFRFSQLGTTATIEA